MAMEAQYGNWLSDPETQSSSTELQPKGIYVCAGAPPFPLKTKELYSPNSLENENDYDDASFVTPRVPQSQRESSERVISAVKEAGVMKSKEDPSVSKSTERKDQRSLHVIILYVLVAVCFVMWAGLLSLFLLKYTAISEELHTLKTNYSEKLIRVKKYEDYIGKMQIVLEMIPSNNYYKLKEIAASLCDNGNSSVFTSCPRGWEKEEENCYYFSKEKKNWTDAQWDCINRQSHLVSIWTDQEQGFVKDRLNNEIHWLGMTDLEEEGKWRWAEGDLLVSTAFWKIREPKKGAGKNCGIMHPHGTWGSDVCSLPYRWICKNKLIC
ncbi:hepatic lectin isoform X1 [Pogona vitticeps]